jgi:hypothetical protein
VLDRGRRLSSASSRGSSALSGCGATERSSAALRIVSAAAMITPMSTVPV